MMVKSIVSFIFCITIIIRGGGRGERENRSRKNGRKRTKQKKTAEHERDSPWRYRARRQTFFRVSLRPWSHLLPWWMKGVIIDETTQILRYKNTSFASLLLTRVFATLLRGNSGLNAYRLNSLRKSRYIVTFQLSSQKMKTAQIALHASFIPRSMSSYQL